MIPFIICGSDVMLPVSGSLSAEMKACSFLIRTSMACELFGIFAFCPLLLFSFSLMAFFGVCLLSIRASSLFNIKHSLLRSSNVPCLICSGMKLFKLVQHSLGSGFLGIVPVLFS